MKTLTINGLQLNEDAMLTRDQLKNFVGGIGATVNECATFSCSCSGGGDSWTAEYCTTSEIEDAINSKCGGGSGSCTNSGGC